MKAVFDTNILIDYLKGITLAKHEIEKFDIKTISIVTYIEVLIGFDQHPLDTSIKSFLDGFDVIPLDLLIAHTTAKIRQKYKMKLPDAMILATAEQTNATLVTRNTKDFNPSIPIVRIPYQI